MRDFFISYTAADRQWAEWIAWTLADAGYTHWFQAWDFRPGGNFVADMQQAVVDSGRTLIVLSKAYLASLFTQAEWAAAFAADPTGSGRRLFPVRVEDCEPPGLLRAVTYCDVVGLDAATARQRLLDALQPSGGPSAAPLFPGGASQSTLTAFPGAPAAPKAGPDALRDAAAELRTIFGTSRATFEAQVRVRDDLALRLRERLRIREDYEYEELFDRYFERLDAQELRLHKTIRGFTASVLHEYNRRAKQILDANPRLADFLPSFRALENHLILWLSKYDSTFLTTPSMCLLYVGVDEGARFPGHIEKELEEFIRTGQRAEEEPEPDDASEEWAGHEEVSYGSMRAAQMKRFHALEQRLAEMAEAAAGERATIGSERLETEVAYADALAHAVLPTIMPPPDALFAKARALADAACNAPRAGWPDALSRAADKLQQIVADKSDNTVWPMMEALPLLPLFAFHEAELGAGNLPTTLWIEARDVFRGRVYD